MKLNLGKTPEEQAAEEAKKQKERELEIQQAHLERQRKIEALRNKQKVNKIILIGTASALIATLVGCNVYHIFLKKDLTINDVDSRISNKVATIAYPGDGLSNYVRDISQTLFDEHIGFDNKIYVSAVIDKNSVYISRVKRINSIFSQVYFKADVVMTERDSRVTDSNILAILKKGGLKNTRTTSSMSRLASDTENSSTEAANSNTTVENTTASENAVPETTTSAENSIEPSVTTSNSVAAEPTNDSTVVGNVELVDANGNAIEYYLTANGSYMQKGAITTQRYTFMIPVEYYYNYNEQNVAISSGYKTVGKMELYSLNEVDLFEEPENTHKYYEFNKDTAVDEATLNSARQTVNKIFADIYEGTVLPQDFVNARTFDTYGAEYVKLDAFEFYTETNPLGYNAVATYTIKLPQGFLYTTTVYLTVEPNNTTWKITNMT